MAFNRFDDIDALLFYFGTYKRKAHPKSMDEPLIETVWKNPLSVSWKVFLDGT